MSGQQRLAAPMGLLIDREQPISFSFEGRRYSGYKGDSIASALIANGQWLISRSFKYHRPRSVADPGRARTPTPWFSCPLNPMCWRTVPRSARG